MIKNEIQRCDEHLIKCTDLICLERIKRGIDKRTPSFRRMTKAYANLIMTDTEIKERLINAILEDDRRNNNGYEKE